MSTKLPEDAAKPYCKVAVTEAIVPSSQEQRKFKELRVHFNEIIKNMKDESVWQQGPAHAILCIMGHAPTGNSRMDHGRRVTQKEDTYLMSLPEKQEKISVKEWLDLLGIKSELKTEKKFYISMQRT